MSSNHEQLKFYIQTINNTNKIILHNPTSEMYRINKNEPLFQISARTKAIFVSISNNNVEFSDMYLQNLTIPVDIESSDPDLEKANPLDI